MTSGTDEARWAEAQSLLDRMPTESAQERLRRWRRLRLLFVLGMAVVGLVVGLVVVLLVDGGMDSAEDEPLWREIVGLVVLGIATVVIVAGLVVQLRGNRRLHVWRNPLAPLTRAQNKELIAQVRGRREPVAEHLPLARYMAELLVHQRTAMTGQIGLLLLFAGQWIMSPTAWRLVVAAVLAGTLLLAMPFLRRDVARGRAFLDAHPAPESSAA
jgi:hypothetical protein